MLGAYGLYQDINSLIYSFNFTMIFIMVAQGAIMVSGLKIQVQCMR